jgi:hypothetical protein
LLRKTILIPFLLLYAIAFPQTKHLEAIKAVQAPKIDGELDDPAWQTAPAATDFIQNFPHYGSPSAVRTSVKILYDDYAVYVGAYLYDDPKVIRKQLTARDEEQQTDVDYFSVFFDTYHDKQNGFQFLVTSRNVQTDARLGPNLGGDYNNYGDRTWDAVWDSQVKMQADGWTVEMKIPYLSLRFAKKDTQDWGVQFQRFTRRNNETSFWNAVDPNVNGLVNQFGEYNGLKNIQPPLRLSFSPYVTGGVRVTPEKDGYRTEWLRNGGMDVKYGINESFTLDATIIPDFGQVVSDNVINNLSPFEVKFEEHRPFFTEGTEIFNKAGLFYSRRVGATPKGYQSIQRLGNSDPNIEVLKNPTVTQLFNAVKFSGRTQNKLGIGVFNAVAAQMNARVRDRANGNETKIETEPLTNYNIFVLDQALKGRSYLTFTNTNVIREGSEQRDANVSAFDFSLYDRSNTYNIKGTGRYSKIYGPDPYDGFNTMVRAGKVSGNFQFWAQNVIKSDKYDPNDLGYLQSTNEISYSGEAGYYQFKPERNLLNYHYKAGFRYARMYDPNAYSDFHMYGEAFWWFKNFWDVTFTLASFPSDQHDYYVLNTPGKFVKRPAYSFAEVEGSTDSRKRFFFNYEFLIAKFDEPEKNYHIAEAGVRYRFSNKLSLELSGRHEAEKNYIVLAGESAGEPIIGFTDFTDVETIFSGIYNFAPRLNLTLRARHYWSSVPYNKFAKVTSTGDYDFNTSFTTPDENVNYFNVDAFLTWDFRLGSRIVLNYKNWLGDDEYLDPKIYPTYFKNLSGSFSLPHANEFTVKFIYFLDYNQLRKKK